jgi:hypothetical protein
MKKLLKALLIISSISILLFLLIGGLPSISSTSSEFIQYGAFLLIIFGYYIANYSKYRRLGIFITIVSSIPLVIFFLTFPVGFLLNFL